MEAIYKFLQESNWENWSIASIKPEWITDHVTCEERSWSIDFKIGEDEMSRMSRTQCAAKEREGQQGRGRPRTSDGEKKRKREEECWHPLRRALRSIQKRGVNVTHFEIRWNLIQRTLIFTAPFSSLTSRERTFSSLNNHQLLTL